MLREPLILRFWALNAKVFYVSESAWFGLNWLDNSSVVVFLVPKVMVKVAQDGAVEQLTAAVERKTGISVNNVS